MFEVRTREMPARRLMLIQRRQHGDQTDAFVAEQRRHSSLTSERLRPPDRSC
jgi:hypothetical protein